MTKKTKDFIFVTGTDTDIGKTIITAAIIDLFQINNRPIAYLKPVQTGGVDVDLNEVQRILKKEIFHIPSIAQYSEPLSPDQAANLTNERQINLDEIIFELNKIEHETIVIEGAGGLLVPLNNQGETWLDFLKQVECNIILVSCDRLGMINHTSLSLSVLQHNNLDAQFTIINQYKNERNLKSLQNMFPKNTFLTYPVLDKFNFEEHRTQLLPLCALSKKIFEEKSLIDADKQYCWHPYTQHLHALSPLIATKAKGSYIEFHNTEKLIDGSSSWWVNTIGHGRKEIAEAIYQQQQKLDHVIFANVTHEPAINLASQIVAMTQGHLQKVFFSDNGSTSVEVGLKMAYQSFANKGDFKRTKFLGFYGSYHGDTFGTMSVAKSDGFHKVYEPLMFDCVWAKPLTSHPSYICPNGIEDKNQIFTELEEQFEKHHHELAGVIIEPLVQGAGGMLIQPVEFLKFLESLCHNYQVPLILDEVFSGMGRTGANFAFLRAGISPDIICIAKGLTGGNLPLALTIAKEEYYESFLHTERSKALLHGHSYTANPISCAAALATLKIYSDENLIEKSLDLETKFYFWLEQMKTEFSIENPRAIGGIMAYELPGTGFNDYFAENISMFIAEARKGGVFLRSLGNTIYFVPPLTINNKDLSTALRGMKQALSKFCDFSLPG